MRFSHVFSCLFIIASCDGNIALAADDPANEQSFHLGLFHPNGVDLAGYSVERKFSNQFSDHIYSYYNFGFPSLAATGLSYYENRHGNGLTATAGVGIGFVLYGSAAYQWKIEHDQYVKLGAGLGFGVAYGGLLPVISYEHRFKE